jgi:hypothetical protein
VVGHGASTPQGVAELPAHRRAGVEEGLVRRIAASLSALHDRTRPSAGRTPGSAGVVLA